MAVFADTQAHNIHGILLQDLSVAGAFRRSVRRCAVNIVDALELLMAENVIIQICAKALGAALRETHIFIHMHGVDLAPVDIFAKE